MINDDIIKVLLEAYQDPKGDSFHELYERALIPFSPKLAYDTIRANRILELMLSRDLLIENGHPWYKVSGHGIDLIENYKSSSVSSVEAGNKNKAAYKPPIIATPIIKQILIGIFVTVIGGLLLWLIIG